MSDESYAASDLRYDLHLTLEEAVAGKRMTLRYPRVVRCEKCGSRGTVPSHRRLLGHTTCAACGGFGLLTSHDEEVEVVVPGGVDTGSRVRVPGRGNEDRGGRAGDLYVVTHVARHEDFKREGEDLYTDAHVTAAELASGTVVDLKTLVDGPMLLRVPAGTNEGTVICVSGRGVPSLRTPGYRGNLFVTIGKAEPVAPPAEPVAAGADQSHDDEARAAAESGSREDATRRLRVFLCHSSGDKPAVRALYQRLRDDGITPWLDEEDLLPGEKWEEEIPKAVRSCDVVIVCLSHGSINKRGYLQKEIRHALDAAEEQPAGTIFLIPLKLEECEIPGHLSGWQWVNLFEEQGYARLMRALRKRARSL